VINGKKFIAIIPARGGSKGVPGKNIKEIAGRPLIAYTADQAETVTEIDRTVLSTEDAKIKSVAQKLGLTVIDRPSELAEDATRSEPVMVHALDGAEQLDGQSYDYIVLLEPTSPLRTPETILKCMQKIVETGAPSLLTVVKSTEFLGELKDNKFKPLFPQERGRRQDRPERFYMSGTVFTCSTGHIRQTGELMCNNWPYEIVNGEEIVDINTQADFDYAEYLLKRRAAKI
jgi:CMP-N,N'-diacetyllegionaminic acid synthase